jgi:hypothetical protein
MRRGWPSRPIKLVVPTGPGAATGVMARLLSEGMRPLLGQPVIVENTAGAGGTIGVGRVARAAPDGYTFLFTNTSGMIFNKISFKQLPYDPLRDFTPVASVCSQGPQMVSVNVSVPAQSVAELIAYAKANRGKLSIAFDVTAGAAGVATRLFNKRADLGLTEVPYRSAAQMAQDAASGVNPVLMSSIAAANRGGVGRQGAAARDHLGDALPRLARLPALNETLPASWSTAGSASSRRPARRADCCARQSRDRRVPQEPGDSAAPISFGLATNGSGRRNQPGN